ncbi:tRNA (N6-isopentenyl adenosine(37)-C2)-methylthiotransferase MiaB [Patescibacteria group bacterium]|nr:tRNA (N6-isopentenyl adenosine(37)-C2)-methylthiotransferase MiaB [Patescibacteria group bacterium]
MKYYIITYGCQMNKSDSERIATALENISYQPALKIEQADLIVVNMCSVRQSAVDRVYGLDKKFIELKKQNPKLKTVLTGCVLKPDKNKLKKQFDLIFDIKNLTKLSKILCSPFIIPRSNALEYFSVLPVSDSPVSAYVPIMTGCNNFCAYCVVPYVRGREISRPAQKIINEIKKLIKKGYKEIILLGQNVNSYKDRNIDFPKLLELINNLPGKFWIRFLTSHPKDLSDELIEIIANCKKITEYLHLPVQAGDNQILKKMNRGYTLEQYKELIKKIRKKIKNISISTDIIVGFPGETKKQFKQTVKLMKWAKFDMAYTAQYSPRPMTAASKLKDDVPKEEKKKREKILTKILKKTALKNNKRYVNKTIEVLIENKNKDNSFLGKTRTFKNVKIKDPKGSLKIGQFVKIKITGARPWGLEGRA